MERDEADLDQRILDRVRHLNERRGWPWQQPGVISVGLDEQGRVREYLATKTGPVPLGLVDGPGQAS